MYLGIIKITHWYYIQVLMWFARDVAPLFYPQINYAFKRNEQNL